MKAKALPNTNASNRRLLREVLGVSIQLVREDRGQSRPQVARELGVTTNAIRQWEIGEAVPTLRRIPSLMQWVSAA